MIKDLLIEGFALKKSGYYKHAIEVFYKALEEDNTSSELLLEIAELYYIMHNEEKALGYIEQVLKKEPAHINALKLLERIFLDKNALAEAEQTAKNIYCISHNDEDLAKIFNILNREGKFDEIFEYRLNEPERDVLFELAKAYFYKQDYEESENLLKKILSKTPENQDVLLFAGNLYRAENKKEDALLIAKKLNFDETNPVLLDFLAYTENLQGNYNKAAAYLENAIKLSRSNDIFYFHLAGIYFKNGDIAQAKKNYNLAISINPENKNYHFALANLYYSEKHYKKALEELDLDFFEAKLLKAVILYDTGYLALAQKELNELAAEQPENPIIKDYRQKIRDDLGLS